VTRRPPRGPRRIHGPAGGGTVLCPRA
jgi:hypothetical protein